MKFLCLVFRDIESRRFQPELCSIPFTQQAGDSTSVIFSRSDLAAGADSHLVTDYSEKVSKSLIHLD